MNSMQTALVEMNARLSNVEGGLVRLRDEVRESNDRQGAILAEMQHHAEAMRRDAEAMRKDAEAMKEDSVAMRREVVRHTAQFDQVSARVLDDLQHYQGNVGKVMGLLIERDAEQLARHEDLVRRVDDIERRLAG